MTVQEDVTDPARPVAATVLLEAADGTRRAQQLTARQPFATTSMLSCADPFQYAQHASLSCARISCAAGSCT